MYWKCSLFLEENTLWEIPSALLFSPVTSPIYVGILQQCLYSNTVRVDGLYTVGIRVWSAYAYREHESEVFMYLQCTINAFEKRKKAHVRTTYLSAA